MAPEEPDTAQFEEAYYLARYPDVANAVKQGTFLSGFDHYRIIGRAEERLPGRSSEIPQPQNAGTAQAPEIRPTIVDGKSLEDLLVFAVKKRFEPLLQQYLKDNSTAVMNGVMPLMVEFMDEHLPPLLETAVSKELARAK